MLVLFIMLAYVIVLITFVIKLARRDNDILTLTDQRNRWETTAQRYASDYQEFVKRYNEAKSESLKQRTAFEVAVKSAGLTLITREELPLFTIGLPVKIEDSKGAVLPLDGDMLDRLAGREYDDDLIERAAAAIADCTRDEDHEGPCNGVPTVTCPVIKSWDARDKAKGRTRKKAKAA